MKYLLFLIFLSLAVQGEESDFPPAVKAAEKAIVKIVIKDSQQNKNVSQGTGFLLEDPGNPGSVLLVTNFHVISDFNKESSLHFETRSGKTLQFKKIKHLSIYPDDLAVLEVKGEEEASLKLGAIPNNEVYVLGFPGGEFRKIKGKDMKRKKDILYFSPEFYGESKGRSGSPMLNGQGEVFGIHFGGTRTFLGIRLGSDNFIFGVPADNLKKLLRRKELPLKKPEDLIKEEKAVLERFAKEGDSEAQYRLGTSFMEEENYDKAGYWFIKAMEQDHAGARQGFLEIQMIFEDLEEQDFINKEIKNFKQSLKRAQEGNVKSQYYVGQIFLSGLNSDGIGYDPAEHIDHKKAREWFKRAAEQGHSLSQCRLGIMLFEGHGGEQDYKEARKWLTKAAEGNNPEAQYKLGVKLLEEKSGSWKRDPKEAIKWLERATEQGDIIREAEVRADNILFENMEKNYEEEKEFFDLGWHPYHVEAQYKLGTVFLEGLGGIEPDYKKARNWFMQTIVQVRKDSNNDSYSSSVSVHFKKLAQYQLGMMSFKGLGLEAPDYQEAFEKFSLAGKEESDKEEGYVEAQYMLGTMFFKGLGVKPDREEAYRWFSRAANQRHAKAQRVLNRLFKEEVKRDRSPREISFKDLFKNGGLEEKCYRAISGNSNPSASLK